MTATPYTKFLIGWSGLPNAYNIEKLFVKPDELTVLWTFTFMRWLLKQPASSWVMFLWWSRCNQQRVCMGFFQPLSVPKILGVIDFHKVYSSWQNITDLMHCGIERGQNRWIVGYILPSFQSHNASNLWFFFILDKPCDELDHMHDFGCTSPYLFITTPSWSRLILKSIFKHPRFLEPEVVVKTTYMWVLWTWVVLELNIVCAVLQEGNSHYTPNTYFICLASCSRATGAGHYVIQHTLNMILCLCWISHESHTIMWNSTWFFVYVEFHMIVCDSCILPCILVNFCTYKVGNSNVVQTLRGYVRWWCNALT